MVGRRLAVGLTILSLGCQADDRALRVSTPDMAFVPIGESPRGGQSSTALDATMPIAEGESRQVPPNQDEPVSGRPMDPIDEAVSNESEAAGRMTPVAEQSDEAADADTGDAEDVSNSNVAEQQDVPPLPKPKLAITFHPIDHNAAALRLTDIAFIPESQEFIAIDKDGAVIHMRLEEDGATRLGGFIIEDTWVDSDAGLISIALDPAFIENRYMYVGLSTDMETNVIRRYRFDTSNYLGIAETATEIIAVRGAGAQRSWHNIGSIGFTEEGYLWGLFGDKVRQQRAQDLNSPLGSLIRIIPRRDADGGYEIPVDNPYADGSGHPAVFAKGMRSPWKGHYVDGQWFFGDIGLDGFEEINQIVLPGDNFGWPDVEGLCQNECEQYVDPWVHYGRSSRHPFVVDDPLATSARWRSVWVGLVYRPMENVPDPYRQRWRDVIVFGDTFSGFVRARPVDGATNSYAVGHVTNVTAMAQGPDGYVYATGLGTWPIDAPMQQSPIYRIKLTPQPPTNEEDP